MIWSLRRICAVLLALPLLSAAGGTLFEQLRIAEDGSFSLGEVEFRIQHFAPGWRCTTQSQATAGTIERDPLADGIRLVGTYPTATGARFQFEQEIAPRGTDALRYAASLRHPAGIATEQLALGIFLPVDLFVGVPLQLGEREWICPEQPFADAVVARDIPSLVLPTPAGRLVFAGPLSVQIQDGRGFADKRHFRFRMYFAPENGTIRQADLAFGMRLEPYDDAHPKPQFGQEFAIVADDTWQPLSHRVFTVPGSLLDWSAMTERPAGTQGPVVVRDGHLALSGRPEEPLRLFGTNICDKANFQDPLQADALAAQLACLGHNTVRLHHYDRHLVARGKTLAEGWDTTALDKLDYLFAALKRQGLYITIDLYTVRPVVAGEIEEVNHGVWLNEFKALVGVSPSAMANWKEFARRLLTHVNPYTGLAWKDDPALFAICLLNENNLPAVWNASPATARLYRQRFADWLAAKGRTRPEGDMESSQPWAEFLIETHRKMYRECAAYVRSLGTHALLTDANFRADLPLALLREEFDYVDSHAYYDHRTFLAAPFRLPYRYRQISPLADPLPVPRSVLAARHFGTPFLVTEFNYVYPNHYRAVGGPLFGACAALQDWDGLYRYAYAHDPRRVHAPDSIFYLDNVGDPLNLLADRIAVLLFRRRDVMAASGALPFAYDGRALAAERPLDTRHGQVSAAYCQAGLRMRVGLIRTDAVPPGTAVVAKPPLARGEDWLADDESLADRLKERGMRGADGTCRSETGEILFEPGRGRFAVVTPRTECLALHEDGTISGSAVRAETEGGMGVVCVSAMDGRPLPHSRRLLLFHLTDVQNTGVTFRNPEHTILTAWGGLPHLVRRGTARVAIDFAEALPVHVHELDLDGARRGPWPAERNDATLVLDARTVTAGGTRLLYEIVRGE